MTSPRTFAPAVTFKFFAEPDTSKWDMTPEQIAETVATRREHFNTYDRGHWKSDAIIEIEGCSRAGGPGGWFIGGWGSEGQGRTEFQGPMVQGPHAYVSGRAACIAANPAHSTKGEHDRARDENRFFTMKAGDRLALPGGTFELTLCRRGYPTLTLIG